jgi:hypothetical protein
MWRRRARGRLGSGGKTVFSPAANVVPELRVARASHSSAVRSGDRMFASAGGAALRERREINRIHQFLPVSNPETCE